MQFHQAQRGKPSTHDIRGCVWAEQSIPQHVPAALSTQRMFQECESAKHV